MKQRYAFFSIVLFMVVGAYAYADDFYANSENKFGEILGVCEQTKTRSVCGCVVKNLDTKFRNGQFGEPQLNDALMAVKGSPAAADYMADLMTGLEFHCIENSNYSE
jgi:hypothetical protein